MRSPVIDRHAGVRARLVRAKGPEAALIAHADSLRRWEIPNSDRRAVAAAHSATEDGRQDPVVQPGPKTTVARVLGSADSG